MPDVSQIDHARRIAIGVWRSCIALCLIFITSPVWWLIDYDKMKLFVKRYGIDVMAILSVIFGSWMYADMHPIRGIMFAAFCLLMSVLQDPDGYFK